MKCSHFKLENEIWKDIPNYEGYQVSNLGRVRTYNKTTFTKRHGVRKWKNRILKFKEKNPTSKKSKNGTGYRVNLWKNGETKSFLVARLVAFTFYNQDINNHELTVDHIDGNRLNNNLNNLELVSLGENIKRAFETGLMSNQIKVNLINKKTLEEKTYRSMSLASKYMGKGEKYISNNIRKNIFENKEYKWQIN